MNLEKLVQRAHPPLESLGSFTESRCTATTRSIGSQGADSGRTVGVAVPFALAANALLFAVT